MEKNSDSIKYIGIAFLKEKRIVVDYSPEEKKEVLIKVIIIIVN